MAKVKDPKMPITSTTEIVKDGSKLVNEK